MSRQPYAFGWRCGREQRVAQSAHTPWVVAQELQVLEIFEILSGADSWLKLEAEFSREAAQLVVGEGGDILLVQVDIRNDRLVALQLAGIWITQQELEHQRKHKVVEFYH